MSITRFFTTPVTIVTAGTTTDRYGDEVADWTAPVSEESARGWLTQVSTTETVGARDVIVTGWKLYLPTSANVTTGDRIVANGITFDIDGDPFLAPVPGRPYHHWEMALREVQDEWLSASS